MEGEKKQKTEARLVFTEMNKFVRRKVGVAFNSEKFPLVSGPATQAQLTTVTDSTCDVMCGTGYAGQPWTLECDSGATTGTPMTGADQGCSGMVGPSVSDEFAEISATHCD